MEIESFHIVLELIRLISHAIYHKGKSFGLWILCFR